VKVALQLPAKHSLKQGVIMNALAIQGVTEVWVANGTKYGKTIAAATALCSQAPLRKQALYRWVAPIYMQAKIGYQYCSRMLPAEPHVKRHDGEPSLLFRGIDTRIQFFHGQRPESLEGEATHGNILDEAAKMREEVYAAVKTTTTVTRGKILLVSTPLGKNWFYKGCMSAKEEMVRAKHEGRQPTKLFINAPSTDNPAVSAAAIVEARKSLPDRLYRQFYLAEFVDDGQVFSGFRASQYGLHLSFDNVQRQHWLHPEAKEMRVVLGVDWAKTRDWTVFIAIDTATRKVVGFLRFHNLPYTEAIRELVRFKRSFMEVDVCLHDKTGVGMAIDDQLAYTDIPYRGIVFTNTSKAEMVSRLITAFEQRALGIPAWDLMEAELDAFEVQASAMGRMQYSAPAGDHDDIVCALMLANSAFLESSGDDEVTYLEDLGKGMEPSALELYYTDLDDD